MGSRPWCGSPDHAPDILDHQPADFLGRVVRCCWLRVSCCFACFAYTRAVTALCWIFKDFFMLVALLIFYKQSALEFFGTKN